MTKTALPEHPDPSVKTTVELPDTPYRKAKAEAALRGRKLQDLIEEGLNILLDSPPDAIRHPSLSELMKDALGVVESGVFDLGSNAERLRDFGRSASNR